MNDLTIWVYIITNQYKGSLYIGHTDDIEHRMQQHINGEFEGFSKKYGLKHLVWFEEHATRDAAFEQERRMKAWRRNWKLNLIEDMNPFWLDLHTVPYWPLPKEEGFQDKLQACMEHRLDPGIRRDERRFV